MHLFSALWYMTEVLILVPQNYVITSKIKIIAEKCINGYFQLASKACEGSLTTR